MKKELLLKEIGKYIDRGLKNNTLSYDYFDTDKEYKKQVLIDMGEKIDLCKDFSDDIKNCPKCGCNSVSEYGDEIQCNNTNCEKGIKTFGNNLAILFWNNGLF